MEILITYFSDQLVTGFSTAATVHVFVVQMVDLFGLYDLPKRLGAGNILMV